MICIYKCKAHTAHNPADKKVIVLFMGKIDFHEPRRGHAHNKLLRGGANRTSPLAPPHNL